jgi:hypothetical protein
MKKCKAEIRTVIKTVPHPEPQRLDNLWAKIVLKEILDREKISIYNRRKNLSFR